MRLPNPSYLFLCLLLLVPALGRAAESPDPRAQGLSPNERLEALVERVRTAQADLDTLEARFVQTRESELLVGSQEARGTLSYQAPDRVRWEFQTPDPISILVTDEQMTTWYRDLGRAERLAVGKASARVFEYLGATGSVDRLLEYFRVELTLPRGDDAYRLDLKPKYRRIEKRLAGMSLWIDATSFLPVRLRYEEPGGDVTDYRFEDLAINQPIPDGRFVLDLPDDVELVSSGR